MTWLPMAPGECHRIVWSRACPCLRPPDLQTSEERWTVCSGSQDFLGIKGLRSRREAKKADRVDRSMDKEVESGLETLALGKGLKPVV